MLDRLRLCGQAPVALYRLVFGHFTVDSGAGPFLCFGAGMIIGVAGPIVYTRIRGRSLRSLGFRLDNRRQALATGAVFAGVQVALTLFGYDFPAPERWVPLLVLALAVGLFEAVFFRGFVQTRLEASFGSVVGVGGAATPYGLYQGVAAPTNKVKGEELEQAHEARGNGVRRDGCHRSTRHHPTPDAARRALANRPVRSGDARTARPRTTASTDHER